MGSGPLESSAGVVTASFEAALSNRRPGGQRLMPVMVGFGSLPGVTTTTNDSPLTNDIPFYFPRVRSLSYTLYTRIIYSENRGAASLAEVRCRRSNKHSSIFDCINPIQTPFKSIVLCPFHETEAHEAGARDTAESITKNLL